MSINSVLHHSSHQEKGRIKNWKINPRESGIFSTLLNAISSSYKLSNSPSLLRRIKSPDFISWINYFIKIYIYIFKKIKINFGSHNISLLGRLTLLYRLNPVRVVKRTLKEPDSKEQKRFLNSYILKIRTKRFLKSLFLCTDFKNLEIKL
ncbi:hypothetical protein BpHYR1_034834 [Brachionus plicatilis]|uniref:Uncharacterized protein n=1 Tax=Brachionus plicatilis TaxID=10195 RepID=A0A3M7T9U3_BRAPC|nr:hypothetical protein BpHYR1_034834 [Brachionus plicatilis]